MRVEAIARHRTAGWRLAIAGGLTALLIGAVFLQGLDGFDGFILALRAQRLAALSVVGIAIALSTVAFQTITDNRILTPSIMGLDALYVTGQAALVLMSGGFGYALIDARLKFALAVVLMGVVAFALLMPLMRARVGMTQMLLCGAVLSMLLRSLGELIGRLIDPNEYAYVQAASFASVTSVRGDILLVTAVVVGVGAAMLWRDRHVLDAMALGRDQAVGLGVDWQPALMRMLAVVVALVAVSTALVGPVVFFGLLVTALTDRLFGDWRHAVRLPAAALLAVALLVAAHGLMTLVLGQAGSLGIVIDLVGGLTFLLLLMKGRAS